MADAEHPIIVRARLLLFSGDIDGLNKLRKQHPHVPLVFRDENLRALDLRGADLRGSLIELSDLRQADLREAQLDGATLLGCKLQKAQLDQASMVGVRIGTHEGERQEGKTSIPVRTPCYMQEASLTEADLSHAHLKANLQGADLSRACLQRATLVDVDLRGVRLNEADGAYATMRGDPEHLKVFQAVEPTTAMQDAPTRVQGFNTFGLRLQSSNNASGLGAPDVKWAEGTVSVDPATMTNERKEGKKELMANGNPKDTRVLSVDRFKSSAAKGVLRFGAKRAVSTVSGIIVKALKTSNLFEEKTMVRVEAFSSSDAGKAIMTMLMSGALHTGVLRRIPMIPKNVQELLEGPVAEEMEVAGFERGLDAISDQFLPLLGEFGTALTMLATQLNSEIDEINAAEKGGQLPAGNRSNNAIGVDTVAASTAEAVAHKTS